MKFLLDTQAFLWFVLNERALSQVDCDVNPTPSNGLASDWLSTPTPALLNQGMIVAGRGIERSFR